MNVHELPMILFTVIAQLCVGSFVVLGVMQLVASIRHDRATVERLTEPVVYALGPAMVLGLAVSMLHMNDISNTLNVLRHAGSSWLSREIIFGSAFAGLGFAFALLQWFRIGTSRLRQLVAGLTALAGLALVWSMAQIYYSVVAVPAWHTPIVPFHFFATTIMLGALAVSTVLLITATVRQRREATLTADPATGDRPVTTSGATGRSSRPAADDGEPGGSRRVVAATAVKERVAQINAPTTTAEWVLTTRTVQWLALVSAVVAIAVLVSYPVHIAALAGGDATALASSQVFAGSFFVLRLLLLGLAAAGLAIFVFRSAGDAVRDQPQVLTSLLLVAFTLTFAAELMGRSLHYDSMLRIGI